MALQMRMGLLIALFFAAIYAIVVVFGTAMGVGSFNVYLIFAAVIMAIQFFVGPKMVEWSMRVQYVKREDYPQLYAMVEDQARRARIPMPRVCVSPMTIPNAFAFGRGRSDGRVCVTEGIMRLLNHDELKAVIGHEIAHIRNRDVITITVLSVIPLIMYRLAWHFLFFGSGRRNDNGSGAMLGMAAFLFYFLTNLIVLYGSRVREFYADKGSVEFGNRPEALATALYKLVYGSARVDKRQLKETEGVKAFFVNDPSQAQKEIRELAGVDADRSGTIDPDELAALRNATITLKTSDKMMEFLSTHPNMLKRIQHLATLTPA